MESDRTVPMLRKLMLILLFLLVAGVSTWLRFGDLDAPRRWLASLSLPKPQAPAPAAVREEELPIHQGFSGMISVPRDGLLVVHFRRADGADDATAKARITIHDGGGQMVREVSLWGGFRRETPAGASMARYTVGGLSAGSYKVTVDLGSQAALSVKRAALELAVSGYDPLWTELSKAR